MYSGRSSVSFWYVVLCISMLTCFGCDFLKCALILRADFACEEYLAWVLRKQVLFFFVFLLNYTYASVEHVETFQIVVGAWSSCDFSTEHWCAKTLSIILILKKATPKVDVLYSQYSSVSVVLKRHCLLLAVSALPWKHLISCCQCSQSLTFPPR